MEKVSSTAFTQRPVDTRRDPMTPLTEWEYDEKHAGESPRQLSNSDSTMSDLCEFSVSSDSFLDIGVDNDELGACQVTAVGEPDDQELLAMDPKDIGRSLKGDLDFLAESHKRAEERMNQRESISKAAVSRFKYTYFDDVSEQTGSKLPQLSIASDFVSTETMKEPECSHKLPEFMKPAGRLPEGSQRAKEIAARTSQLRKAKDEGKQIEEPSLSPKKKKTPSIVESGSVSREDIARRTSELRGMKTPNTETQNFNFSIKKMSSTMDQPEFEISDDDELEQMIPHDDEPVRTVHASAELTYEGRTDLDELRTTDLLKTIPDIPSISDEAYARLNRSPNRTQEVEPKSFASPERKSTAYPANPPSLFSKYIEEHPPPPKLQIETPTRFKYNPPEVKDNEPEMMKRDPPKPRVPRRNPDEQRDDRIVYAVKPIADKSPKFLKEPNRQKMARKKSPEADVMAIADKALKEFEFSDDEKAIDDYKRKQKVKQLVQECAGVKLDDQKSPRKTRTKKEEEQKEKERKMFYDPAETKASKLRNQVIRQKFAVLHERKRMEEEEEYERKMKEREVGKRINPELRRLAKISEERQQKNHKFSGRFNDPKAVESLERAVKNVQGTEVMLRRNDRSMILRDCQNKRRKESLAEAKRVEIEGLQARKNANERLMKKWRA